MPFSILTVERDIFVSPCLEVFRATFRGNWTTFSCKYLVFAKDQFLTPVGFVELAIDIVGDNIMTKNIDESIKPKKENVCSWKNYIDDSKNTC